MRRKRGFIQYALLQLLQEGKYHGYQMMKALEERSGGAYAASAGTIYPALQEMLDQGLIEMNLVGDKKIYEISAVGVEYLQEKAKHYPGDFWEQWQEKMTWKKSEESLRIRQAFDEWEDAARGAISTVRQNPKNIEELIETLHQMRDQLKAFSARGKA